MIRDMATAARRPSPTDTHPVRASRGARAARHCVPPPAKGAILMAARSASAIRANPKFQQLVDARTSFGVRLSIVMLAIYFGFILIIAFAPGLLGVKLGSGVMTVGIPVGLGVIISAFLLTGVYVRRANAEFDELTRQIVKEAE
jgi:uncharacterized membrane protein (DUF485 family)